jgi:hypothetical protein
VTLILCPEDKVRDVPAGNPSVKEVERIPREA